MDSKPRVQKPKNSAYLNGIKAGRASRGGAENSRADAADGRGGVPARQTALTRREKKELKQRRREKEWNENIERIRIGHDWVFLTIVVILLSIGTVMVYSASYPSAIADGLGGFYYVGRQLMWIGIGTAAMLVMAFVPAGAIKKVSPIIYAFGAMLLFLVLFIGTESGGAKRWIKITSSFRIQPSEIAKLALTIILAWYASKFEERFKNTDNKLSKFLYGIVFPSLFIFFYALLVIFEKHLSGTVIIVAIGCIVMYLAGSDWKMMLPYYAVLGGAGAAAYLITHPYALERITTFTNENADILDEKWQTYQGTLAIGSGGFLGLGLGHSRQKHSYVSEAQNDFIFTIWCEEMGFVGALLIVALFLALIFRGYKIALKAPDTFSSLLVFGIITQVGLQAFLNIMVVTDIIPNTGISLPFLSYGGSSLVMMMAEMGIVLSVSRRSYQKLK